MVRSFADGWGESRHRKPLERAALSRPHASPSGTSSASRALAFLPGRVSCAAEACGLFLRSASVRHGPKSPFFARSVSFQTAPNFL